MERYKQSNSDVIQKYKLIEIYFTVNIFFYLVLMFICKSVCHPFNDLCNENMLHKYIKHASYISVSGQSAALFIYTSSSNVTFFILYTILLLCYIVIYFLSFLLLELKNK